MLLESQATLATLDVVLNSTALEDLCVSVVTQDGSAVGGCIM